MQTRTKDFISGGLILAGVIVLYLFPDSRAWQIDLAKAAIMVGLLVMLVRIHRAVRAFLYPPQAPEAQQGELEMRLLIKSMGIIARADGVIDKQEIETIREIHARMFGINLDKKDVDQILNQLGSAVDILSELGQNKSKISPLMKQKIIQACHLVTISDLDIDKRERAQIAAIGMALGFEEDEIKEIVAIAEI